MNSSDGKLLRLDELDGARGLAVLLVVFYHYFSRFSDLYPYPSLEWPILRVGNLGVHLFFMISGFVIAITIENSPGIGAFAYKRLLRLWPPLLVCSLLTFMVMQSLHNRFTAVRAVTPLSFIPSLTFSTPELWFWLFPNVTHVDGVYWTLFFEVRFYALAAIIKFLLKVNQLSVAFSVLIMAHILLNAASQIHGLGVLRVISRNILCSDFLSLFCVGVILKEIYAGRRDRLVFALLAFCSVVALTSTEGLEAKAVLVVMISGFTAYALFKWEAGIVRIPAVRQIGLASYSIYLLHQNIGLALLSEMGAEVPLAVKYAIAICAIGAIILVGTVVYELVEKRIPPLVDRLLGVRRNRRVEERRLAP